MISMTADLAKAVFAMTARSLDMGGDGRLSQPEAVLAEDNMTIVVYAKDGAGHDVWWGFDLPSPIKPAGFDPCPYERAMAAVFEGLALQ